MGNSALRQTNVPWIDLGQNVCLAVFAADFVLHLALVERPRRYLFSFTGLIDASAVLFFFVPQVRSELLLWVFKLLKFIDEARVLVQALGEVPAPSASFCSSSSCSRWCSATAFL